MNIDDITRLWSEVTAAAEAADADAFQIAFWRLEGAFLRASQELWEMRPRGRQDSSAALCPKPVRRLGRPLKQEAEAARRGAPAFQRGRQVERHPLDRQRGSEA
jgi:hypothetical protein